MEQASKAEADLRFDVAADRLYELLIASPGTADAPAARVRLARLLALAGDLQPAILECQLLRDELPADHPMRQQAIELATTLGRRLRAASGMSYYPTSETVTGRGVQSMDEPRAVVFESEGRFLLLDQGAGRVYRIGPDTATLMSAGQEPSALAVMPDGVVAVAGKTGLVTIPASRTVQLVGTWGGKTRQVKKIRSIAALSNGDLLVVDRDYDGLLRCQVSAGTCAAWGPIGKFRVVRVGASDWIYLLDDRGQSVRVIDANLKPIALLGPTVGTTALEKVEDIAVDNAHGLYLLDTSLKRVHIVNLRTAPDGRVGSVVAGSILLPQEGERAIKNASAIGVAPSGWLVIAAKSSPRIMRYR